MMCWTHKWAEQSRHFNPPTSEEFKGNTSKDALLKVMYGTTTIILRCVVCGNLKAEYFVGDARIPAP